MSWPTAHAPLRNAVFHLLSAPELKDTLCSFDRLVVPLNMIGGGIGLGDFAEVDSKLITTAFSRRGEEYLIPFKQLKIHKAGNAVMLCRVRKRISRGTPTSLVVLVLPMTCRTTQYQGHTIVWPTILLSNHHSGKFVL